MSHLVVQQTATQHLVKQHFITTYLVTQHLAVQHLVKRHIITQHLLITQQGIIILCDDVHNFRTSRGHATLVQV